MRVLAHETGWASAAELLDALRSRGGTWRELTRVDLVAMIDASSKRRYEIDGERIRAMYGHSVPGRLERALAEPPAVLFHGTSRRAWAAIREEGLVPMRRQYVHLSVDADMAHQVGRRKADRPVILRVRAAEAAREGVRFYRGNEMVWLTDAVPAPFLDGPE